MIRAALVMLVCAVATAHTAWAATASIATEVTNSGVVGSRAATLIVTVDSTEKADVLTISLQPPDGFAVDPQRSELKNVQGRAVQRFKVFRLARYVDAGQYKVVVDATTQSGTGAPTHAPMAVQNFSYRPDLSVELFFALGVVGILFGWAARLVVNALKDVPQPQPAPPVAGALPGPGQPGPVTQFVTRHYFLTDVVVTIAIGFFVLVALTKDGHPPDNASYWYTAASIGVGLGLLTNSELLTRIGH